MRGDNNAILLTVAAAIILKGKLHALWQRNVVNFVCPLLSVLRIRHSEMTYMYIVSGGALNSTHSLLCVLHGRRSTLA